MMIAAAGGKHQKYTRTQICSGRGRAYSAMSVLRAALWEKKRSCRNTRGWMDMLLALRLGDTAKFSCSWPTKPDIAWIYRVFFLTDFEPLVWNNDCTSLRISDVTLSEMKQSLSLTCIIHHIDVGSQFGAGKVVAVLNRVVESR